MSCFITINKEYEHLNDLKIALENEDFGTAFVCINGLQCHIYYKELDTIKLQLVNGISSMVKTGNKDVIDWVSHLMFDVQLEIEKQRREILSS